MRFQPALLITNDNYDKIVSGEIKLQCGQWIYLWDTSSKSRFVGITKGGTFWATHTTKPAPFRRLAARIKEAPFKA